MAACVANGWDTGSYLDPAHPIQELAREGLRRPAKTQPDTGGSAATPECRTGP
ncbi:hypothetical protein [Kitasatospora sp. NPDC001683]